MPHDFRQLRELQSVPGGEHHLLETSLYNRNRQYPVMLHLQVAPHRPHFSILLKGDPSGYPVD